MSRQGLVHGLPALKQVHTTCEACILGKHQCHPIPRHSMTITTRPLELVHSDLCGPFPHPSLQGSRYILTFIDDFSRRSWVYFLAIKSDTFKIFCEFLHMVERETSQKLSCLRSDRGGEYLSQEFRTFCLHNGIKDN